MRETESERAIARVALPAASPPMCSGRPSSRCSCRTCTDRAQSETEAQSGAEAEAETEGTVLLQQAHFRAHTR
eukprot:COSAG03_NODE_304_length_9180_cov_78.498293_9_plen_73_part_00